MSVSWLWRLRVACLGLAPLLNHTLPRCLCDPSAFNFSNFAVWVPGWSIDHCCQRLAIATPPMFLIILKFLSQGRRLGLFLQLLETFALGFGLGLGLGLGNAANGWRYLGPPLRHCCRLQACWSKGKGGGYEERSHALHRHASRQVQLVYT